MVSQAEARSHNQEPRTPDRMWTGPLGVAASGGEPVSDGAMWLFASVGWGIVGLAIIYRSGWIGRLVQRLRTHRPEPPIWPEQSHICAIDDARQRPLSDAAVGRDIPERSGA